MFRLSVLFLIVSLCACAQLPPHACTFSGRIASVEDTIFLYRQAGLERTLVDYIPLKPAGDSMDCNVQVDSLTQGWYYLGLAPNALTTVFLTPGEKVDISGLVGNAGLYLRPPSAQSRWGAAAREFVEIDNAVEAAVKVAMTNYHNGEEEAYADYAFVARREYQVLLGWIDSMTIIDPYLTLEFKLRLVPPYLPETGTYENEQAFQQQDAYLKALLKRHGQTLADFPALVFAVDTWMNLQNRTESWANSPRRADRLTNLLETIPTGSLLHQNMLASAVSVLDQWRDPELVRFIQQYRQHYPASRRTESFLQARVRMIQNLYPPKHSSSP